MKILWICSIPNSVASEFICPPIVNFAPHSSSWIESHLPPPVNLELHIACGVPGLPSSQDFEYMGAFWHLIPFPKSGRSKKFFLFDHLFYKDLISSLNPDVVHAWGTEDSNSIVALRLAPRITVVGIQGLMREYFFVIEKKHIIRNLICTFYEYLSIRRARFLLAESSFSASKVHPSPQSTVKVIEHPLREQFLSAAVQPAERKKIILFVGSINHRKGIQDAIIAFSKSAPEEWRLQVVGEGDPSYLSEMKGLSQNLGVASRMDWLGNLSTPEMVEKMAAASIFLLPSKSDTGPTALKEAICMGLWPICYKNSGPEEYITKYSWGSLAKDRSLADLAEKLSFAIENKVWESGKLDLYEVRKQFNKDSAWSKLISIYSKVKSSD
jgi:glycosyltransferase involved in cell wall biosynthesis